jgi:hypothetical protein
MTIGILSSIKYHPKMQTAFQNGFVSTAGPLPALVIREDLGFNATKIDPAIEFLNGRADMIVTFGGAAACNRMVALTASGDNQLPFVSLVGSSYGLTLSGLFRGFVTLADITTDIGRVTWLANHVKNAVSGPSSSGGNIGLYYNSNTSWGPHEAASFTGASTVAVSSATLDDPSLTNFSNDLAGFPAGTRAVVVSASFFFHKN